MFFSIEDPIQALEDAIRERDQEMIFRILDLCKNHLEKAFITNATHIAKILKYWEKQLYEKQYEVIVAFR